MAAPLRNIAKELYRLHQEVERLGSLLKSASTEEKVSLENQLRRILAERKYIQKIIDGHKEPPPYRKPR